jgi:hypothetical protein
MVQHLKQDDGKLLNLPRRRSRKAISGALGARMSFRIVEIAPQQPGKTPRGPICTAISRSASTCSQDTARRTQST